MRHVYTFLLFIITVLSPILAGRGGGASPGDEEAPRACVTLYKLDGEGLRDTAVSPPESGLLIPIILPRPCLRLQKGATGFSLS